jgi:hypothetical protein
MIDQYGEQVDLYSFCGKYVDLFFFQFNELAPISEYAALSCWIQDMKHVHSYYRDYGYELLVVVTQNNDDELPTEDDLAAVAAMLGLVSSPVLASADESMGGLHSQYEVDFHEPTLVHLGPELNVLSVDNDDCAGGRSRSVSLHGRLGPGRRVLGRPGRRLRGAGSAPVPGCPVLRVSGTGVQRLLRRMSAPVLSATTGSSFPAPTG